MQVMTQPPGTQTEQIARFALGLQLCALPPKVLALAKRHLLDTLGIAVASTGFDFGKVTLDAVQPMGHGEDASAIGSGLRLPAPSAALLNATLAHGLDYDDTHIGGVYHASAAAMGPPSPQDRPAARTGLRCWWPMLRQWRLDAASRSQVRAS